MNSCLDIHNSALALVVSEDVHPFDSHTVSCVCPHLVNVHHYNPLHGLVTQHLTCCSTLATCTDDKQSDHLLVNTLE